MHFSKMTVNGNRIFIVEEHAVLNQECSISCIMQKVLGREFGASCDQAVIYKSLDKLCMYSVIFYNDDGSRAGMCGNGVCCLGKFLHSITGITEFEFLIAERIVKVTVSDNSCRANLGNANFNDSMLLYNTTTSLNMIKDTVSDFLYENNMPSFDEIFSIGISFVDFGNPHVILLSEAKVAENYLEKIMLNVGFKIENLQCFKDRANVSFGYISDSTINLFVWERGSGYTGACGSGSCATVAALHKVKNINEDKMYKIRQRAGNSNVYILEDGSVTLETFPVFCFSGEFSHPC